MNKKPIDIKSDLHTIKHTSLMGTFGGAPSAVESAEGKITRIRPLHYDEYKDWESLNPWEMKARGRTFGPPKKSLISWIGFGYRSASIRRTGSFIR